MDGLLFFAGLLMAAGIVIFVCAGGALMPGKNKKGKAKKKGKKDKKKYG